MPNFDGTGHEGKGTLTGRRSGHCGNNKHERTSQTYKTSEAAEEVIYGRGRGGRPWGGGKGQGRAMRRRKCMGKHINNAE